jgi:transposase-like protein
VVETGLTQPANPESTPDRRANRRSFTNEQKLAIVMESEEPSVSAAAVCRRHEIATSMLFRWRAQFGLSRTTRSRCQRSQLAEGKKLAPATAGVRSFCVICCRSPTA